MYNNDSIKINNKGHLEIGGIDSLDLVKNYGTPLYVFDVAHFKTLATSMVNSLKKHYGCGEICYASKAFATTAIYQQANQLGLSVDVVSGGELYLALLGGVDAKKIYFHGNAKTNEEIDYAVKSGVGTIVLESFDECEKISQTAKKYNTVQGVMIRVNPGVEAHTHSFVQTAKTDSKFGIQLDDQNLLSLIKSISNDDNLSFEGLHSHIGSQIFDVTPYIVTLEKLVNYIKILKNNGISVKKLNMGGGFAVTYTDDEPKFDYKDYDNFISQISSNLLSFLKRENLEKPSLIFEPGRSLVASCGMTLYKIVAIKDIPDIRKYVSVDGGMFDNPRHALYGSRYEGVICDKAGQEKTDKVTISGKCCESGDIITSDIYIQPQKIGDILGIFNTGAYNYSMASNYNCNFIPPVVAVYDGQSDYIVKKQTYEDLARNNVIPQFMKKDNK